MEKGVRKRASIIVCALIFSSSEKNKNNFNGKIIVNKQNNFFKMKEFKSICRIEKKNEVKFANKSR